MESPDAAAADAAEVHALARRIEAEPSASRREAMAEQAVAAGQRCERAMPGAPACEYALAIALGVQARERPTTVHEGLAQMAARLRRVATADPRLDRAGPDRVLALLLLRAPGWPLGPGDPEEGLAAARRAVALYPDHAPNQLALAEALRANGDGDAAHAAARRALALADAAVATGDADAAGWRRDARRLLDAP
ncbi:MAG TPA: hypothetical protein VLT61_03465 [Anaeromyxobacteraceae bacterium]|nr:hypothetical protein [Anaeromyxobacteraceae bacterium]